MNPEDVEIMRDRLPVLYDAAVIDDLELTELGELVRQEIVGVGGQAYEELRRRWSTHAETARVPVEHMATAQRLCDLIVLCMAPPHQRDPHLRLLPVPTIEDRRLALLVQRYLDLHGALIRRLLIGEDAHLF